MDFKKFTPHLIAAAVLFAVSAVFFAPNFFGGKVLPQPDNDRARGMMTEIQDYLKKVNPLRFGPTPLLAECQGTKSIRLSMVI
ncbi:MAG: hypothetical protein IPH31_06505 [Lewinellaceae bacterium]|nr:hypothetical protein [Lewinellaceae bacterium]